ncbi:MAG: hypothetical protein AAF489_10840 [Bacteroidota bacterium]
MPSRAEQILILSDHPMARKIADHAASGLTFGQSLAEFDLSDKVLRQIHYNKSSIETALKMGKPVKEVIYEHFPRQKTRDTVMDAIEKAWDKWGK